MSEAQASEMDVFHKGICEWSWKENKVFELALAMVDENHPQRWEVVAALLGGKKSAGEIQKHYVILLEDLELIESGKLDQQLGEARPCLLVEGIKSLCFSVDETNM
uniref:Myb-like domain-containing protein n=1 Tax=Lotus japonicus TaxID=34305 RepID=I3SZN8_LOTJA|nr:unknown [Lotus japonicus]